MPLQATLFDSPRRGALRSLGQGSRAPNFVSSWDEDALQLKLRSPPLGPHRAIGRSSFISSDPALSGSLYLRVGYSRLLTLPYVS